jgi:hypothetical protein
MAVGAPVSVADPEFYESVSDGNVFSAMTALTGVAPGTAIGTTAAFALTNPAGSGVDLVIIEGQFGYISGTLGAGVITWNANIDDDLALPTGTAINEINMKLGNGTQAQGRALTTATIAAPIPVRILGNLQASLATTAVGPWQIRDRVDGAIVVPPGCTISLHATAAAGSTPLGVFCVTWKEQNAA